MRNKKELTLALATLQSFEEPSMKDEQYSTPADIAADVLWNAQMLGDIEHDATTTDENETREVLDLGCGNGILGIAALLLGAHSVLFLDKDESALAICRKNLHTMDIDDEHYVLVHEEIQNSDLHADLCLCNPPFGTKIKNADRIFLEKGMRSTVLYFFHKTTTQDFIEKMVAKGGKTITHRWLYRWPLKATMEHHRKRNEYIDVSVIRVV